MNRTEIALDLIGGIGQYIYDQDTYQSVMSALNELEGNTNV